MSEHMQCPVFFGVDVAKDEVVVARHGQAASACVANSARALRDWLKTLPSGAHIGLESTGGYHDLLARLAHQAGFRLYVLNPRDVRHYGQALGRRAKTDRVDALLLARYVAHEHSGLHRWQPPTPEQQHLGQLLKRRAVLVRAQGAMRQTLKHVAGVKAESRSALAGMERLLEAIDAQIEQALALQESVSNSARHVRSVPGIGLLTGAALVNLFCRLPGARADAIVAFTGLDPRASDSGKKRGVRRLSKRGPAELRRLLFNAAMSAARTRVWKPYYLHERAKGLPTTAALVCLARRLLRTAFALFRTQTDFNPHYLKIDCIKP